MRPPTRFCASRTIGSWPALASSYAATRPAMPAPMTMTRFPGWSRRSNGCMPAVCPTKRPLDEPSGRRSGVVGAARLDRQLAVGALQLVAGERALDVRADLGHADRALALRGGERHRGAVHEDADAEHEVLIGDPRPPVDGARDGQRGLLRVAPRERDRPA